jgi:23S rRNA (uracil1939-C5)-methyltransferase
MINIFEVRINSLAYGGEPLGKLPDGRVVFVPFAIPGELVRLSITEDKPRYARGELVEVLEASSERVTPRCPHFTFCGGCHYQHMNYPTQLKVKADILREQLERIGGLRDLPMVDVMAMSEPWDYRNSVQFHITQAGELGFQKAHSKQTFAIRECHLPEASLNQLWPLIEVEPDSSVERVSLRAGASEEMVILESADPRPVEFNIESLAASVVQRGPTGNMVLAGNDYIMMEALGRRFRVSAGSFFQVNTLQAQAMVRYLTDHLPLAERGTLVDVYSGVGFFSAFLGPRVKRLVGIEISPEACEDFCSNLDEFDNVELYEDSAEHVLRRVNFNPDIMIMDPPRAGLGGRTVEGVLAQGATQLAYISCDPATLARDGKQLAAGGYSLIKLAVIDMFPQTYHIESISMWEKKV